MEPTPLQQEMRARIRRHWLVSLAGFVGTILLGAGLGGAARALDLPPTVRGAVAVVALLLLPTAGFYSTWKNLRCPSCDRNVAFLVSANFSAFATRAPKTCRGCGQKIFDDAGAKRFFRFFVVAFAFGVVLAIVSLVLRQH